MKAVSKRKFIAVLKKLGLEHKRTTAGHEVWDKPNNPLVRPIVLRRTAKDIDPIIIYSNLRTLGISAAEFEKLLREV